MITGELLVFNGYSLIPTRAATLLKALTLFFYRWQLANKQTQNINKHKTQTNTEHKKIKTEKKYYQANVEYLIEARPLHSNDCPIMSSP